MLPNLRARSMVTLNGTPVSGRPPDGLASDLPPLLPERYVLAVGGLTPREAYDVRVKAIGLARDRGHHLDLVIVGDGPEASRLATLAKALNVEDQVFFAGDMPHAGAL